ncbi:hypothetical protein BBR47_08070 [Brevibacillus brevis NBRC 100599]|uniref:Uncharacterized protein n=1 Tax=Brevibacillus brevis (strain 47 / JCM 6285 / NBRC 100599) TaxID=358681 RepID=C0Z4Q7_BREBN|nr:hypothetical protein BBR47_08070 [Brevibacillus brevis NBRC 100599]
MIFAGAFGLENKKKDRGQMSSDDPILGFFHKVVQKIDF